jgi:hypothetical protein
MATVGAPAAMLACLCALAAGAYGKGSTNAVVVPSAPFTLGPGVYKTEPYSCIVVVPGPHLDDRFVVRPGTTNFPMPVVKPGLRFIPWKPGK